MDGEMLLLCVEIVVNDVGCFWVIVLENGKLEEFFEVVDFVFECGVFLDGEFVGGVEMGELLVGFDEFVFGVGV